jgi:hypothetical protein
MVRSQEYQGGGTPWQAIKRKVLSSEIVGAVV